MHLLEKSIPVLEVVNVNKIMEGKAPIEEPTMHHNSVGVTESVDGPPPGYTPANLSNVEVEGKLS